MHASSLIEGVRCQLGPAGVPPAGTAPGALLSLREVLERRITDPRRPRGVRHRLSSLVSVLVAGVACGYSSFLAIAGAAAGWDQEVLAAHGTRRSPVTGAHEPPSASTLGRLPALLDADELEAALSQWLAGPALDPAAPPRIAGRAAGRTGARKPRTRKKASAADSLRRVSAAGQVRAAPGHPWLDPAVIGDPGHRPVVRAVGVDGKERKLAKAGGKQKVHLLAAVAHHTGVVISQDRVAKAGKANEITHFRPLLEPLPLTGVLVTADAMQTQRAHARWLVQDKEAHYLLPVEHGSHCSRCSSWRVKESILAVYDLDTEPFAASLGEVDGVEFAALDLVQHGLAGDTEVAGGLAKG